jgi:DNA polymerase I-like protein with 3'-5' exonuclease and polymerase domains
MRHYRSRMSDTPETEAGDVAKLAVPLLVELGAGATWDEAH